MAIVPGTRLGDLVVQSRLGAGASGDVYEAFDTKLNRPVAVKLLPKEDAVLREARAAAKLDHPNVLTVHDVGVDGGRAYLVTELVRGKTLREILHEGAPSLDIAIQIASGLAAAHAAGIVHRDLKPENVVVTDEGVAKILDFGLARPLGPVGSESETDVNPRASGTPGYMAPEQADGRPVDHRADVFSFGCVLYEMLAGSKPFPDLVALLRDDPKPLKAPDELRKLVERMLRKDPAQRLQSIADVPMFLREICLEKKSNRMWLAAVAVALLAFVAWRLWPPSSARPMARTIMVTDYPGDEYEPALSPDGTRVAFPWRRPDDDEAALYVKFLDGGEPLRIASGGGLAEPTWSPDGREIAFLRELPSSALPARHEIAIVSALGGTWRRVGTTRISGHGLDWSPDGDTLVVSDRLADDDGLVLYLLDIVSRKRRRLTEVPEGYEADLLPSFSPTGDRVAFIRRRVIDYNDVYVASIEDGATIRLTQDDREATDVDWSPDGRHVLFASDRDGIPALWKVDVRGGEPELVAAGAERATSLSVAKDSDWLVYREAVDISDIWRVPGPNGARDEPAHPFITSSYEDVIARYSDDGRRIVYQSGPSGRADLWIVDADGSNKHQLVFTEDSRGGSWSPDGSLVVYNSRSAVELVNADGGIPRTVIQDGGAASFSRNGRDIFFATRRSGKPDIWRVSVAGGEPTQLTRKGGIGARSSLDGRFVYYANEGRLCRVPVGGGEEEVVVDKDIHWLRWAVWNDNLVYVANDDAGDFIEMFDPATRTTTQVVRLPEGRLNTGLSVSPDGKWILFSRREQRSDLMMLEGVW